MVCMEGESKPAFPLEKWLVKLIRAKWSLNGVGIDWQGCAAGSCTTGTSPMFDHPEPYNYELNAAPLVSQGTRPLVTNRHALLCVEIALLNLPLRRPFFRFTMRWSDADSKASFTR